jgi:hypothetical protein
VRVERAACCVWRVRVACACGVVCGCGDACGDACGCCCGRLRAAAAGGSSAVVLRQWRCVRLRARALFIGWRTAVWACLLAANAHTHTHPLCAYAHRARPHMPHVSHVPVSHATVSQVRVKRAACCVWRCVRLLLRAAPLLWCPLALHVSPQALLLATTIGASVWVGLAANADASLTLMGLDQASDPHVFGLAREFLLLRASAAPAVLLVTVSQVRGCGWCGV